MTIVTILLAIIIAMLYLGLGLLVFIIDFLHDLNFNELSAEQRKSIKNALVLTVLIWPMILLYAIFSTDQINK